MGANSDTIKGGGLSGRLGTARKSGTGSVDMREFEHKIRNLAQGAGRALVVSLVMISSIWGSTDRHPLKALALEHSNKKVEFILGRQFDAIDLKDGIFPFRLNLGDSHDSGLGVEGELQIIKAKGDFGKNQKK